MIITDEIRKYLVGKNLICKGNNPSLKEGKSYKIIKAEEYKHNKLKTLVTVLSEMGDERTYDLGWFVNEQSDTILYDNKTIYNNLYFSPISYIRLDGVNEDYFIKTLKENKPIIFTSEQRQFTYDKIPEVIKWLKDVYDFCTELKNKVEYVNFSKAKEHMNQGNKSMFEDEIYYIKNDELYCENINSACALKLRAIESDKWILL